MDKKPLLTVLVTLLLVLGWWGFVDTIKCISAESHIKEPVTMSSADLATLSARSIEREYVSGMPCEVETAPETTVEQTTIEETTIAETVAEFEPYNIPLSLELQMYTVRVCQEYGMDPLVVFGVINRESSFRIDVMGDNGLAYGLMQIQPRWNMERLEKFGITELLIPENNILVGVDILAELTGKYGLVGGLTHYRYGCVDGSHDYANDVLTFAAQITKGE